MNYYYQRRNGLIITNQAELMATSLAVDSFGSFHFEDGRVVTMRLTRERLEATVSGPLLGGHRDILECFCAALGEMGLCEPEAAWRELMRADADFEMHRYDEILMISELVM